MEFKEVKKFILRKLRKELPKNLSYHGVEHIKDVYTAAGTLAKMEGIAGEDVTLLLTAALFHDSGFMWQQYEHEQVSCEIAKEYLPSYGYTQQQIERICGMIMATKLPQQPHNELEQIICDADLDYLGRDDFFKISNSLYLELYMYGLITNENEWNKLQIKFLEAHRYFTKSAKQLRKKKKQENIALIKEQLKRAKVPEGHSVE